MAWGERIRCGLLILTAFLLPFVIVGLMSTMLFADPPLPSIVLDPVKSEQPPTFIVQMAKDMINMAIGSLVGAWILFRQPVKASGRFLNLKLSILASLTGFASIYAGLRTQFDIAQQLTHTEFDFGLIDVRFFVQCVMLLAQIGSISALGVNYYLFRDKRFNGGRP